MKEKALSEADVRRLLEDTTCHLADIAFAEDLSDKGARLKAARIYHNLRKVSIDFTGRTQAATSPPRRAATEEGT